MVAFARYQVHSATVEARALHAAHASPVTMTRVYLSAAEHGDCALTGRLTTSHTFSWCAGPLTWVNSDPELLSYRDVGKRAVVAEGVADRREACVPTTIDQRGMSGAEAGRISWGWCWVQTPAGWRLWDQGQG